MLASCMLYIGVVVIMSQTGHVHSHGRLILPAGRSSAWRFGFDNPVNYDDNQLFCGGKGVQWNKKNDGRCGVCGDPYSDAIKPNEDVNGKYVKNGVITGSYVSGQVMLTEVQMTAYHLGWFEFRLCPLATPTTKVTQECLNQTLLRVAGSNVTRMILEDIKLDLGVETYKIHLQLPANIHCERCVLQWRYNTGNSDGCEPKGCCVGCGKQENFVNCADIKITDGGTGSSVEETGHADMMTTLEPYVEHSQTTRPSPTTEAEATTESEVTTESAATTEAVEQEATAAHGKGFKMCSDNKLCRGKGLFSVIPGIAQWCCDVCTNQFCHTSHCECLFVDDILALKNLAY